VKDIVRVVPAMVLFMIFIAVYLVAEHFLGAPLP